MKKLATWVLLLCAFLPLIEISSLNIVTFILGKTILIRGIAFLVILLITLSLFLEKVEIKAELYEKIRSVFRSPLFIALLINIIFLIISTFFAFDRTSAFFGGGERQEGFLTIFTFFTIAVSMAILFGKKEWSLFSVGISLSTFILFVVEVQQVAQGTDRPGSLIGNATILAGFYLFSIFIGCFQIWLSRTSKNRIMMLPGIITILMAVVGIFLADSRGALLALFIALILALVMAVIYGKNLKLGARSLRLVASIVLAVMTISGVTFLATKNASLWQEIPGVNRIAGTSISEGTAASRILLSKMSLNGFFTKTDLVALSFGWGWDNYVFFFQSHYQPKIYIYDYAMADRAHNKLIDVLVMSGIFGLLSYLAIFCLLYTYSIRLIKKQFFLGLSAFFFITAYFVNNLFVFDLGVTYLAFFVIIAFLYQKSLYEKP